ncbi:zinc ribbon domain-containing protein [Desulfotalea psychrophila]|uniref:Uncharacterized protein n=1 Tax=Desulfotalea psychrophila (strain LSv54 / DSM 12343) TaxID=177439 RepID=Q6AQL1_DESPS|nr:C4-type zinc ribbon domain-containing protein [Desulfotalea psychrophila]CAG35362.1 hypothetical protein DP0633 [Desulfotalea psychrophila LSv54]
MNENIEQLVVLQEIDLGIDKIDGQIESVQEALDSRIQALADKEELIKSLDSAVNGKKSEIKTLELEMEEKVSHVRERQAKMMQVQTGREQTALLKEIEDAKKAAKENEIKIIAIMEESESVAAEMKTEKNLLRGEKKLVAEETEKVRLAIEKINKQKQSSSEKRKKQASTIEASLLKKYEILRERRNGLAMVNVLDGVCQGCYMAIPPQRYNMLLRGDLMFDCPICNRIMYHEPEAL